MSLTGGDFDPIHSSQQSGQHDVQQALDRVLQSRRLQQSRRLSQFLRFVVDESLAGRGNALKQYQIAVGALGRDETFDPEADPIVRVEARRLRGVLAHYYENEGAADLIRIELPKGGYAPVFRPNTPKPPERPATGIAAASAAQCIEGPTIALLALKPVGSDPRHSDMAQGLSEELGTAFTRFKFVTVIGPIASEELVGQGTPDQLVGQRYGADYLVQGTVETRNERLIVTPRLLNCATGRTVWSDRFDFDHDSIDSQSRSWAIRRMVAEIIDFHGAMFGHWTRKALSRGARIPKAQEALANYRAWRTALDQESHAAAVKACLDAAARWPTDFVANALTADVLLAGYVAGLDLEDCSIERAEQTARRAVALEPKSQFARFALGKVFMAQGERTPAVAEFEEALSLNPYSACLRTRIGLCLCFAGDWDRGVGLVEEACALSPDNFVARFALAMVRYREGAFEAAWTEAFRINHPDIYWAPLLRAAILGQLGRREAASAELGKLLRLSPDFAERGRERMRLALFADENVDMVIDGLRKAGLECQ